MIILTNFRIAWRSLWANKMRSFLTLLGIVIGIYAVVTLLSLAQGIQKQIADQVEGLGPRTIIILPGETEEGTSTPNFAAQFAPSTLKATDITLLRGDADLVEPDTIDYAIILGGILRAGDKKATATPIGATIGLPENVGYKTLASGRALTNQDISNKAPVMFINQAVADKLSVKVGDTIQLGKTSFTVEGIYNNPENGGIGPADATNAAIMPVTVAQDITGSNQVNRIIVKAKDVNMVNDAKAQVTTLLTQAHGANDFTVLLSSDLLKSVTQITDILKYAVVGIAAISLLVGGIGISNIMLVTVTERTREIGIRKAVGATESAIMIQFLIEAVLLTVIGALLGIGLARITTLVVARFSPLEPVMTLSTVLMAIGMGAIAGVIFGLFPAFRAARKNPVEALRFE